MSPFDFSVRKPIKDWFHTSRFQNLAHIIKAILVSLPRGRRALSSKNHLKIETNNRQIAANHKIGFNHARRVKQLSSIFLMKMRTVSIKSRRAALKVCLIGIYTLLYKASLSKSTLSHGVCQLGMQPNQVCPGTDGGMQKKEESRGCKKALTMVHMIGTAFQRRIFWRNINSSQRFTENRDSNKS